MKKNEQVSDSSLGVIKRTKILATVGPATNSYHAILEMVKAGVNGFRLNFSHGSFEERKEQIQWIREASADEGVHVAIVQDLQGPKIRLGDFEGITNVKAGQELQLAYNADFVDGSVLPVQYDLSKKVKRGDRIFMYDGKVKSRVTSVRGNSVYVRIENDGILMQRKGLNLPDTDFGGDIITKKDREDLVFGSEHDVDFVALSFVQTAADVRHLKKLLNNLGSQSRIITKVETKSAVDNIEEIVQESDAVMVARGDLAIETMPESVPVTQRKIIGLCLQYEKMSIVATQMLASMMGQPEPTRAEVSDVATAVIVGADTVMLSDETANGRYPIESIEIMKRIIMYTQQNSTVRAQFTNTHGYSIPEAISSVIIGLAEKVSARAIVAETMTGATAISISSWRPNLPIIVVTPEKRIAQQLALLYGAETFIRPTDKYAATKLTDWLQSKRTFQSGDIIVTASGMYPGLVGGTDTIKVRTLK